MVKTNPKFIQSPLASFTALGSGGSLGGGTPSDAIAFPVPTRGLYVGGTGNISALLGRSTDATAAFITALN